MRTKELLKTVANKGKLSPSGDVMSRVINKHTVTTNRYGNYFKIENDKEVRHSTPKDSSATVSVGNAQITAFKLLAMVWLDNPNKYLYVCLKDINKLPVIGNLAFTDILAGRDNKLLTAKIITAAVKVIESKEATISEVRDILGVSFPIMKKLMKLTEKEIKEMYR